MSVVPFFRDFLISYFQVPLKASVIVASLWLCSFEAFAAMCAVGHTAKSLNGRCVFWDEKGQKDYMCGAVVKQGQKDYM